MEKCAIEVNSISKRFGDFPAVDNVSFSVNEGEVFGLLGPNGAGKTTIIRILTTLMLPTSGEARIGGFSVIKEGGMVRRIIGVVSQAMTTDLDLTGKENLDIYGRFYEIPKKDRLDRISNLLNVIGLNERADDLVASYSGGMRRRLEIARGLMNHPKVLFLDEPTIGLDPQSRRVIWKLIEKIRTDYKITISLTTHYMEEAEAICNTVAIIDNGKIAAIASPDSLKDTIPSGDIVELRLLNPSESILSELGRAEGVDKITEENEHIKISLKKDGSSLYLVDTIRKLGGIIANISIRQKTLEDVFIHYTGQSIRDNRDVKKVNFFIGAGVPRKLNR